MGAIVIAWITSLAIGLVFLVVMRVVDVDPEAVGWPWRAAVTAIVAVPVGVVAYRVLLERSG